jgi:hypothetical protein
MPPPLIFTVQLLGQIRPGFQGDVLLIDCDPLQDLTLF